MEVGKIRYDGGVLQRATNRHLRELLPRVVGRIGARCADRPDLVMAAWGDIVGPKLAPSAVAESFVDGVLTVSVAHSPLYSVLQRDREQLVRKLRRRFPKTKIQMIRLRIGG